ncbi:phosphoribosylanthranilate isomerase [Allobacillus sp. GCM10007491]|uniref:N-(5'-phosphoribosyl)anthranilate isomerase n=1 Tax=Allobacillus saliphilus TaxID=2912308 RepID=A0A941CWH8_9BACI|nr:phosphoribosylanthranilate isomerase [Allobacillus saliphilus]MBR7553940.1 phosphoribosylanthranilate isomerase [Allobacillus saliphilus]
MIVKICGVQDKETALAVAASGADFIGFVFAESSRRVEPEVVKEITDSLPQTIKKVGVFVNESPEEINQIAAFAGLDMIQLHGDETPTECEQIDNPVIKAFSIRELHDLERISMYDVAYSLVDHPGGKYRGGSGQSFDWQILNQRTPRHSQIILAGGLHPGNVQEAIKTAKPFGVDVSSGVETGGRKDVSKIHAFVAQAKSKEMKI